MRNKLKYIIVGLIIFLLIAVYYLTRPLKKPWEMSDEEHKKLLIEEVNNRLRKNSYSARTTKIVFYGRGIDQNGNPVTEAKVKATAETFNPNPLAYFRGLGDCESKTDSNGVFIFNTTGKSISLNNIEKEGYELIWDEAKNNEYYYALEKIDNPEYVKIHKPDPNNPVVFRMRKKEKSEVLIGYKEIREYLDEDGIYSFNAFSKKIVKGKYDNAHIYFILLNLKDKGETTLKITVSGRVGILECKKNDYLAPVSGYDKELAYTLYETKDKDGMPSREWRIARNGAEPISIQDNSDGDFSFNEKYFFISMENGKYYGRIAAYLDPDYNNKYYLRFSLYVNPLEGHRVLEYDEDLNYQATGNGKFDELARKFPIYAQEAVLCNLIDKLPEEDTPEWKFNLKEWWEKGEKLPDK